MAFLLQLSVDAGLVGLCKIFLVLRGDVAVPDLRQKVMQTDMLTFSKPLQLEHTRLRGDGSLMVVSMALPDPYALNVFLKKPVNCSFEGVSLILVGGGKLDTIYTVASKFLKTVFECQIFTPLNLKL